jgi:hypothetical protein
MSPNGGGDGHGREAVLFEGFTFDSTAFVAFGRSVGKVAVFAYIKLRAAKTETTRKTIIAGQHRAVKNIRRICL